MRVLVVNHISLDGVLQGPARPDEDTRGGFRQGGWVHHGDDPEIGAALGERMGADFRWLFGHFSYDDMLTYWNGVGGPFADGLNQTTKYVASTDPHADLPWPNSILLTGDVSSAVAELRDQPGGNLVIMGSGQLIRSLLPHGLIDELFLMIQPVVLGSGQTMFGPDPEAHRLRLIDCTTSASGILLVTYRPVSAEGLTRA